MTQAATIDEFPHWTVHPLVRAFVISLALHMGTFTALEMGNRFDLWRFSPLALVAKALRLDLSAGPNAERALSRAIRLEQEPGALEREQIIPIQFVDVDPTQASPEAPPATQYYGNVNSLAGNRDTSRDLPEPELDGTQDRVLKTMNSERAGAPQPMQPAPAVPQQPQAGQDAVAIKPQPVVAQAPPTATKPIPPSSPADAQKPQPPGNTLMARANTAASPSVAVVPSNPGTEARTRPRTVAAAMAQRQINPNSALVGEKTRQTGGVKRFQIASSLNVAASPLGNYDAEFIAAVQHCWFSLLDEQQYSLECVGKVVIDFRLTPDGRITDLRAVESEVGDIYTAICQLAITKPAPYKSWPTDVRKMIGSAHRDVRFTFYY